MTNDNMLRTNGITKINSRIYTPIILFAEAETIYEDCIKYNAGSNDVEIMSRMLKSCLERTSKATCKQFQFYPYFIELSIPNVSAIHTNFEGLQPQ